MEFRKHRLANGLDIVAECDGDAHSAAIGFFVQTGARDETSEVSGVSHFLEHMVFKGTARRSAEDVNREFDEMGADYNAYTSEENTVYYAAVLPEHQSATVDLLADIMRPALRDDDFNTEKQVIIEEIRMYDDQPPFGADEKIKAAHFREHPLARSVLGTVESITQLRVDAMRAYFERRYSPGNIVLAAAGRIDFDRLVADADTACGGWRSFEASRETPRANGHGEFQLITKESATQEYVLQIANGPSATDDERYAAKVLGAILGDDSGSRLYWELVDDGRAEQCSMGHYDYQGTGLFMTYMSCDPENAKSNLATILDVYRRAQRDGVTAEELSQAKNKINSRIVLGSERPRRRLFSVGGNWLMRKEYRPVSKDLEAIDAITCEEIAAVLERYPLTECTTIAIGPLKKW